MLALLAVFVLGASWWFISAVSSARSNAAAGLHNARVLNEAKQALIGHVARQATRSDEDNPGRLPCPEAAAYYGNPAQEGIAAGSCTLPKVGRLPWRTLGLDKLVDAHGEPLWYVVSAGWAYTSSPLTINSNTRGRLSVDGVANDAVALIIAPGPAFVTGASPGCAPHVQRRPASGTLDLRNYLECENASYPTPDALFATTGPKESFNDHVLRVSASDILTVLEAAIAKRIEREVVPVLRTAYAGPEWGFGSSVFPNAARFNDGANFNPDSYKGSSGTRASAQSRGLLPMVRASSCITPTGCPPEDNEFVQWSADRPTVQITDGTLSILGSECNLVPAQGPTRIECELEVDNASGTLSVRITRILLNALNSFRVLADFHSGSVYTGQTGFVDAQCVISWDTDSNGNAHQSCEGTISITPSGTQPTQTVSVRAPVVSLSMLLSDHRITDPDDPTLGWFVRNRWYEVIHYATSLAHAPGGSPPCGSSCLQIVDHPSSPAGNRALLVLAGRSLSDSARPNGLVSDFLDSDLNRTSELAYEYRRAGASFNDRVIVLDAN